MSARLTPASLYRRLRRKPPREIAAQVARRLAAWTDVDALLFPLLDGDIADSRTAPRDRPAAAPASPRVGWVVVPPGPGSGGHTTLFRMVRAAVEAGLPSTLLLYDRFHGDFRRNEAVIREWWPWLDVDIRPVDERITGYDALVASSWATAHVIAARAHEPVARLYFVQDYEPYFYPRGGVAALAEDSYRFGFRIIALGGMVEESLRRELDVASERVEFGLDGDVYRLLDPPAPRRGVVYYARRHNDRRGHPLAMRALELFHLAHPDEPIHLFGDRIPSPPFPCTQHGSLTPEALNRLYNSVVGGISLSFTNVSLVPEEMLAAGAVPVVNDGWMPRAGVDNPEIAWSEPTPAALAARLGDVVDRSDRAERATRAAAGVVARSWEDTGAAVARILADEISGAGPITPR